MSFFRRNIALLTLLLFFNITATSPSTAQEKKYEWNTKKDVPLLGIGTAGTVTSLVLRSQNTPLGMEHINDLNFEPLFGVDQGATENYSLSSQQTSDILLTASYALPLSTLLIPEARQDMGIISIMLGESILINETLTGITKNLVNRPRPYAFNTNLDDEIRTADDNNLSFFSGHTSYTAMFTFFSAQVLNTYIENPTTRAIIWTGAVLWPAATGYFRYDGGKHFVTDVVVGYVVGAAVGYFIPKIHRKEKEEANPNSFHLDRDASHMLRLVFVF